MDQITLVEPRSLRYARDVITHCHSYPKHPCYAEVRGLVTSKRDIGKIVFLKIADPSGSIQAVCERATLDDLNWQTLKAIQPKDRVHVTGKVGRTKGYDVQLIKWGDGSEVTESRRNMLVIGVDDNDILHFRTFDANGNPQDTNETQHTEKAEAIKALKQALPDLLPPRVLTDADKAQLLIEVTSILGKARIKTGELSVFVDSLSVILTHGIIDVRSTESLLNYGLTGRFFLARLRKRATEFFRTKDFEEYEPQFLGTIPDSSGIEPLNVVFPGWGNPAYLNASPVEQLVEAVLVTGSMRVFSVARCFSAAIRDGFTSAESMVVSSVYLDADLDKLTRMAKDLVSYVLSDITTKPENLINYEELTSQPIQISDLMGLVDTYTIQIIELTPSDESDPHSNVTTAFRLVIPPDTAVVEGHIQTIDSVVCLGCMTLHLERMLKMIVSRILRRLPGMVSSKA